MVICIICTGVIIEPMQCITCENAYCKECIQSWMKKSTMCPFKCSNITVKECSRTIKNLLEKLILKCPYSCSDVMEYTYENLMKHFKLCDRLKNYCPCCNAFVLKTDIKESQEMLNLKDKVIMLEEEILNLKIKNSELQEQLKKPKERPGSAFIHKSNLNIKDRNVGLIDKCEHFKGNYKPIFTCCNKAFPCYICHNEKQTHPYQFSSKVVCLLCNNIYNGTQCSQCNAIQVYKKK